MSRQHVTSVMRPRHAVHGVCTMALYDAQQQSRSRARQRVTIHWISWCEHSSLPKDAHGLLRYSLCSDCCSIQGPSTRERHSSSITRMLGRTIWCASKQTMVASCHGTLLKGVTRGYCFVYWSFHSEHHAYTKFGKYTSLLLSTNYHLNPKNWRIAELFQASGTCHEIHVKGATAASDRTASQVCTLMSR